jgi:hypothetical protein
MENEDEHDVDTASASSGGGGGGGGEVGKVGDSKEDNEEADGTTMENEDEKWYLGKIAQVGRCKQCKKSDVGPISFFYSSTGKSWAACSPCITLEDKKEKADRGVEDGVYEEG